MAEDEPTRRPDVFPEGAVTQIRPSDVRYTLTGESPEKIEFEKEPGLALLLINDIVFLNEHWWEKDWPERAQRTTYIGVNCNDVFAWGCADAEAITLDQLEELYLMWLKDRLWGSAMWCIKQRRELPQSPVEKKIRDAGIWDIDALTTEWGLRANFHSGMMRILSTLQYERYQIWATEQEVSVIPFTSAEWWKGWYEYIAACPQWRDASFEEELAKRRQAWLDEHRPEEIAKEASDEASARQDDQGTGPSD